MKLIDLTGKKFERWTVVKRVFPNSKSNHPIWLCKCDCGTDKIVLGETLRKGTSRSCGCLKKELTSKLFRKRLGLGSMRLLMSSYKFNAKKKGLDYTLTEVQFKELTQKDCYYCGAKPSNITGRNRPAGSYIYNGLDRIDNTKGYIIDNVVTCCKTCNGAKSDLTLQEYKDFIKRSYNKIFKGDPK